MRICLVNAFYNRELATPEALLERYFNPRELAAALQERGHEVTVIQLFHRAAAFERAGVAYRFVAAPRWRRVIATALAAARGREGYARFLRAPAIVAALAEAAPGVVHFNGLTLDRNLGPVARLCASLGVPLTASYHGGRPAPPGPRRSRQRRTLAGVARVMFTTAGHAAPWLEAGVIGDPAKVAECMETSSFFTMVPRARARARTGLEGDPVFLWAGRLEAIKDPLTALEGFRRIARAWPGARLYMAFLTDELGPEVGVFLERSPEIGEKVRLLGRLPFADMADHFNSADFLIQCSHREFGGNAVLEALACGVVPVLTDIPSFRAMTGGGEIGVLFPRGDAAALADGVLALGRARLPQMAERVRGHFEARLSYPVLAARYEEIFRDAGAGD